MRAQAWVIFVLQLFTTYWCCKSRDVLLEVSWAAGHDYTQRELLLLLQLSDIAVFLFLVLFDERWACQSSSVVFSYSFFFGQ